MADLLTLDLSQNNLGDYDAMCEDDDDDDDSEEEVDPLSDYLSLDESLPPLRRILNSYTSDDNDNRQLCVRLFPDALQTISTFAELNILLQVSFILARDNFYIVRIGLLSNVPSILDKMKELVRSGQKDSVFESRQQLLEVTVRMLTDAEMEVRRMGQNVTVNLLGEGREQEEKDELLEKLFPIIKRCLGKDENYDLRTNTAILISKISSLVGQVNVLKYFVPLLPILASDTMFHVRKAFATSCRELCPVLDEELTEKYILPLFLVLCKDEVWGVRKACADVFSDIALTCNLGTRYDHLTPAFLKLLHDDSRWVRKAAYQSLGALISTFYIPNGNQTPAGEEEEEEEDASIDLLSDSFLRDNSLIESTTSEGSGKLDSTVTADSSSDHRHTLPDILPPISGTILGSSTPIRPINGTGSFGEMELLHQDPSFSNFEYWRSPILSLSDEGVAKGEEEKRKKEKEELVTKIGDIKETPEDVTKIPLDLKGKEDSEVKTRLWFEGESGKSETIEDHSKESGRSETIEEDHSKESRRSETIEEDHSKESGTIEDHSKESRRSETIEEDHSKESGTIEDHSKESRSSETIEDHSKESGSSETIEDHSRRSETVEDHSKESGTMEDHSNTTPLPTFNECSNKSSNGGNFGAESAENGVKSAPSMGSNNEIERASDGPVVTTGDQSGGGNSETNVKEIGTSKFQSSCSRDVQEVGGGERTLSAKDTRLRSCSAGSAVRRISVESGLYHRPSQRLMMGDKRRRRWSLDRPYPSNDIPQVRVFVHSASGTVTEQDVSSGPSLSEETNTSLENTQLSQKQGENEKWEEPKTKEEESGDPSLSSLYDNTTTKSEDMELTLEAEQPSSVQYDEMYINQEIVPDELMEVYLSMTEQSRVQAVDTDLLYYCAYSLPGVTLTLGKDHWSLLNPTFNYLAEDLQWKIRRVLAFSLHELARVLGTEITCRDILPIFEEYCTKDVDDVKIGTLTHLYDFFVLLPEDIRKSHLPKALDGLLQIENQKNWRYRNTLAEQLLLLADIFDTGFLEEHLYPLANLLSADVVSEVRNTANLLIGTLLKKISNGNADICHTLLLKLRTSNLPHSNWLRRLMYVKQCELFLLNGYISHEVFARECLENIIILARDRIPNIRIVVAKFLKTSIVTNEYFQCDQNDAFSLEEIQITLECLQHDADRDVKFFAGGEVVETLKLALMPNQFHTKRMRSESHTSSDLDQYQDASDCLDLEPANSSSPHSMEYFDLDPSSSYFSFPMSYAATVGAEKSHDISQDSLRRSHDDVLIRGEYEKTEKVETIILPSDP